MTYKKMLVDNPTCSRRFHIAFDDEGPKRPVEVHCPFCDVVVFKSDSHPAVKLTREENLVIQNTSMADFIVRECNMRDIVSENTQKGKKPGEKIYP